MHSNYRLSGYVVLVQLSLLLSCSLAVTAADSPDPASDYNQVALDVARYEAQLGDLESQFGPYDRSLLEPLQSLSELAAAQADFSRVAELQNRQLQVMRTVLGFRHPDLVPLLQEIIRNEIRLQNWAAVTDQLEHLRYLAAGEGEMVTATLLEVMSQQVYWHLARVYLDDNEPRARNFMQAREISADILKLAKEAYGDDSEQLIPWIHQSSMMEYRLVKLMNADDGIAADTIDRLIRAEGVARLQLYSRSPVGAVNLFGPNNYIPIVEGDDLIGEAYIRDAQYAMADIGEIFEVNGSQEAQAMALIYEADMQLVRNERMAFRKYREARELLLAAGIAESKIEQFFNQPVIIPVSKLILSLDEALAYQASLKENIESYDPDQIHLGQLTAWQEGVPEVSRPETDAQFLNVDIAYNYVDATVSISSSGNVSSVDVLAAHPDDRDVERETWRALRELQVRPAIVDGRARRSRDVHVRYWFLPEQ